MDTHLSLEELHECSTRRDTATSTSSPDSWTFSGHRDALHNQPTKPPSSDRNYGVVHPQSSLMSNCRGETTGACIFDILAPEILLHLWPSDRVASGLAVCKFLREQLVKCPRVLLLTTPGAISDSWSASTFRRLEGRVDLKYRSGPDPFPLFVCAILQAHQLRWHGLAHLDCSAQRLGCSGAAKLVEVLEVCTRLESLNLRGCELSDGSSASDVTTTDPLNGTHRLMRILSRCSNLTLLDLSANGLKCPGICQLQDGWSNLRSLSLSECEVAADGLEHLACRVLPACGALRLLNLSHNPGQGGLSWWESRASALAHALAQHCPQLQTLLLARLPLMLPTVREVTAYLAHGRAIRHLNLSYSCRKARLSAMEVGSALGVCKGLKSLELAGNQLRHVGAMVLAVVVGYCCEVERLDLSDNDMAEQHLEMLTVDVLARKLARPRALTHLDLSSNRLGERGARAIASILPHCTALRTLLLSDAGLAESGVCALGEGLAGASSLRRLDLSGNRVGDGGVKKLLLEGGSGCTSLSELSLVGSGIGVKGVGSLALSLAVCTNLSALHIAGNDFPPELAWTLGVRPLQSPGGASSPQSSAGSPR